MGGWSGVQVALPGIGPLCRLGHSLSETLKYCPVGYRGHSGLPGKHLYEKNKVDRACWCLMSDA